MSNKDDCFALPNSGAIVLLGLRSAYCVFGLSWLFGWEINYMAYFVIVFGVLILAGSLYKMARTN